jgi:glycosyltransferase involved in cell wall biosynthesis
MPPVDLISIVVTTYNRSDAVAQVLRGLAQQDDTNFEVIVADDGSSLIHREALQAAAIASNLQVSHVWHPDIGFTASRVRNRGVSVAKGAYIVFLDGDCVPEIDFVRQHRRLMEPGCFVNGSRVLLSAALTEEVVSGRVGIFAQPLRFWVKKKWSGDAGKLNGLLRLPDFAFRRRKDFLWRGIRSCNLGVWRADFEAVNGFDESFVGWGHEDADFVLRLHNFGIVRKNGYCATEVYHLWHPESSRLQESVNADRVKERQKTHQTQPTIGYLQSLGGDDMVVNRLR